MLRSSLPLLFSLPQLVRCSTPRPCPFLYALSIFCRPGGEVVRLVLSSIGPGADRPTKRKATAPPTGSPGSKTRERPIQVCPRPAGCSRAPVHATDLPVSSCTRPPRPRHARHLHQLAGRKGVEAWRRLSEGRERCRCVRSSPRGATGGASGVEALVLVLDEDTGPAAR